MQSFFYWAMIYEKDLDSGVNQKIMGQIQALRELGFHVWYPLITDTGFLLTDGTERISIGQQGKLPCQVLLIRCLIRYMKKNTPSFSYCYARYPLTDFSFLKLLRFFHRFCRIAVELPTYPYFGERKNKDWIHRCFYYLDALLIGRLKRYVTCFVLTAGGPEKIAGIPTVQMANGVDLSRIPMHEKTYPPDRNPIHVISVSSMETWHGLDRLIAGMQQQMPSRRIILHLVGQGPETEQLKRLADSTDSQNILFHGRQSGKALDVLFEQADLAVSSCGLYRIGLQSAAVLKAREYCARGIPFIYAYDEPGFTDDFPYAKKIANDSSPVLPAQIFAFYDELTQLSSVSASMRAYAEVNFSWKQQLTPVISRLRGTKN